MNTFSEIINKIKTYDRPSIAVAAAGDIKVLLAVKEAVEKKLAYFSLIGDEILIKDLANEIGLPLTDVNIVNEPVKQRACARAVKFVSSGDSQILMKGNIHTATLLKEVLNKEYGLRAGGILSHIAVFEVSLYDRLLLVTDGAMNIEPTLSEKLGIINNCVEVAEALGIERPKVAAIASIETVNEKMDATVDGALLSKMNDRGQIKGAIVDGPLALDNAVSIDAARHKGIDGEVAGRADILLAPNIDVGNALYKSLTFFADEKGGAVIAGARAPIVLTSRADSHEIKLNSIILAILLAEQNK